MNLNKVFIIGRLTNDPQLRNTPGGQSVASFSLATNRNWIAKNGQKQEEVQFHNIVVWGRQAEVASQFLKKGAMAFVEGRLQTRSWQDKSGQTRYTTEIVCERMQMGPRAGGVGGAPFNSGGQKEYSQESPKDNFLDDMKEELPEINLEDDIRSDEIPF
ncbi:MAG: single-stranded DNA-binding protein [Candidatus Paceibacterota bacterium]|jgi:single-strand DNA-binding protein